MLNLIEIENVAGISNKLTLNFNSSKIDYRKQFVNNQFNIVTPTVLYGTNGSGKTSILKTLDNVAQFINRDLQNYKKICEPNIFEDTKISKITLEFSQNNFSYRYILEVFDGNDIIFESLTNLNTQVTYNRDLEIPKEHSFIRILGRTGDNFDIQNAYRFINSICYISTDKYIHRTFDKSWGTILDENSKQLKIIAQNFDCINQVDFKLNNNFNSRINVDVLYKGYTLDYFKNLSSGTRDFYEMFGFILEHPFSILVIDELEKTFHPDVLREVITYITLHFKDIQIISSSHNTNFMKHLRPDQIHFVQNHNDLISVKKLSDLKPGIREIHNIEKLYYGKRFIYE